MGEYVRIQKNGEQFEEGGFVEFAKGELIAKHERIGGSPYYQLDHEVVDEDDGSDGGSEPEPPAVDSKP